MSDTIFDLARHSIHNFVEFDPILVDHKVAMDCRDCEDFLALGLRAYKWLTSCDEARHEADAQGLIDYRGETYHEVTDLFRQWLRPCLHADKWIANLERHGYSPENLTNFRDACAKVAATIEEREWLVRSSAAFHSLAEE